LCRHGVTFAIVSSRGHLHCRVIAVLTSPSRCRGVTFAIVSSWCRLCHCVILSLQGRLRHHITVVSSSPLHCHGVAFTIAPSRCHLCHCVIMVPPSPSCHLVIAGSPSPSHRHGVVFAIASSQCCLHHHTVTVSPSPLRHCGVTFAIVLLRYRLRRVNCSICQHVSTIRNRLSGNFQSWPIAMACHACHMLSFNVSFCVVSDSPMPSGP